MKKLILALLCLCLAPLSFAQDKRYWGNTALNDVHGIYWTYKTYHAGIVDPGSGDFYYKLYANYRKYSKKAYKVKTEAQYQKVLKDYMKAFNDGHVFVVFDKDITPAKDAKDLRALRHPLAVEMFGGNNAWVYLPTFDVPTDTYKNFAPELEKAKNADIIVLDLRYNTGGNSYNGDIVLEALYGKDFAQNNKNKVYKNQRRYIRLSDFSVNAIKQKYHADYAQKVEEAFKRGETIYWNEPYAGEYKEMEPPLKSKVYVLTDGNCFSACLNFMDQLKGIKGITQIGHETGGDTKYMEMSYAPLNSNLGKFAISYVGYTNRPRKDNETYKPDLKYKDDISDTAKIQQWILAI